MNAMKCPQCGEPHDLSDCPRWKMPGYRLLPVALAPHIKDAIRASGHFMPESLWAAIIAAHDLVAPRPADEKAGGQKQCNYTWNCPRCGAGECEEAAEEQADSPTAADAGGQITDKQILEEMKNRWYPPKEPGNSLLQRVYPDEIVAAFRKLMKDRPAAVMAGGLSCQTCSGINGFHDERCQADWIAAAIRDVAELPDRDSPPEWHDAMLVTAEELRTILGNRQPAMGTAGLEHEDPTHANHPGHHDGMTCERAAQVIVDLIESKYPGKAVKFKDVLNALVRDRAIAQSQASAAPVLTDADIRHIEIGKAVERACGELPEGYELLIELERDAGTVRLCVPDTDVTEDDFDERDSFGGKIESAIDFAIVLAATPAKTEGM